MNYSTGNNIMAHHYHDTALALHCARHSLDAIIVSTTAPEYAILTVSSLGVALWTSQSGASEVQNCAIS